MIDHSLPPVSQTEPPATDDDLPITVPIRGMGKTPGTTEMRLFPDQWQAGSETDGHPRLPSPSLRISGRAISGPEQAILNTPTTNLEDVDSDTVEDLAQPGARPRLRVIRGRKVNLEYAIKDGTNYIGRRDDALVEIDLEDQEPAERIWTSRKHAALHFADGSLELEDLNSLNGTFVNRIRVVPGERRKLKINDIVQVGTIQLRVVA
jgi:hypothetical protein